jgi:hypothetical protein
MKSMKSIDTGAASSYGILYKIGGVAALLAAIFFRRLLDAEYSLLTMMGAFNQAPVIESGSISEWFDLLHTHPLLGFIQLSFGDVVNIVLVGLLFLALFVALKRENRSMMTLALFLSVIAVSVNISSNQAFALNSLSNLFASVTTEAQKSSLLIAGQAILAIHNNATFSGSGINPSFLFITIAGLMISVVMMQNNVFGRITACFGLIANITGLAYYAVLIFTPRAVFIPLSISAPFLLVWYILAGIRLLKLDLDVS